MGPFNDRRLSIALFWLGGKGYGELAFDARGRTRRDLVGNTDDQGTHLIVGFTDGKLIELFGHLDGRQFLEAGKAGTFPQDKRV